ncbi:MAG: hypothetical protein MMC33_004114 [Icmadophila ericetorum]|nr:hypothetical protein [Icmadophila ericetorum]
MHHWAATVHDFTVQGLKALAIRGMMEDYPDADYAIGRLQGVMRNWEKDIIWELGNDERVKEFLSKYVGGYQRPSVVLWIVNVEVWKEVEAKVGWELEEEMEEVVVEEKGEDMEEAN